jgi:hypothetical protein
MKQAVHLLELLNAASVVFVSCLMNKKDPLLIRETEKASSVPLGTIPFAGKIDVRYVEGQL